MYDVKTDPRREPKRDKSLGTAAVVEEKDVRVGKDSCCLLERDRVFGQVGCGLAASHSKVAVDDRCHGAQYGVYAIWSQLHARTI